MRLPDNLLAPLEIALNRYLAEDPEALQRLAGYDGKLLALYLRELDAKLYLRPHAGGFQVLGAPAEEDDAVAATVTTSVPVLARMMLSQDKGRSLVLGGDIRIEGDAEFAQSLLGILREADFDPEEWLSRYVGDVAAYRVGQFMRGLFQQGRKAAEDMQRDSLGLLRDETRDLVARSDIREWMDGVDALRNDTERLQARVRRLQETLGDGE